MHQWTSQIVTDQFQEDITMMPTNDEHIPVYRKHKYIDNHHNDSMRTHHGLVINFAHVCTVIVLDMKAIIMSHLSTTVLTIG